MQTPAQRAPLLVLLEGDARQWESWCAERGWHFTAPWTALTEKNVDLRIKALETRTAEATERMHADPMRVYLAGQGEGGSLVFYVAARDPDRWAAAVAVGGTPKPAIDSNRLFAANTSNVPVLWVMASKEDEGLFKRLQEARYNIEARSSATAAQAFDWLAAHRRDEFPETADCETGSQVFPRCYWITVTKFDPTERNDVLDSSHVPPGSGASLDLGGFGYSTTDPGPGILVAFLPDKYQGPLKLQDRIVAINGKAIQNAREYAAMMEQTEEEKPVTVMIERGKERIRQDTRIVLPKREETVTARVQGHYNPDQKGIDIVSRAVSAMQVEVPAQWTPAVINWNGTDVAKAEGAGCWSLSVNKSIQSAGRCK